MWFQGLAPLPVCHRALLKRVGHIPGSTMATDGFDFVTTPSATYEEFKEWESSAQKNYFDAMRKGLTNLSSSPRLDIWLFQHRPGDNFLSRQEEDDAAREQSYLESRWTLLEGVFTGSMQRRETPMRWSGGDLCWNNSHLGLCWCGQRIWADGAYSRHRRLHGLDSHMSSQLLQYRLTIYMGMGRSPSLNTAGDMFKSCWETKFLHTDKVSTLRFWDNRGGSCVEFRGHHGAMDDALQLVNFLASPRFSHTYNGVIAGTVAPLPTSH
ncbi:hypothetical protein EIK77_000689 [Talaromyces pinophilus]|nr:hypothetical protein EIK77_000689 [Talaromyces pinophilus]